MPKPSFKRLLVGFLCPILAWALDGTGQPGPAASQPLYLSDHPELVLSAQQGWGELGWDTAAHAAGQPGAPLQIGEQKYGKGLGHHANGIITVLLDGSFAIFDSEVGLQPCGADGSVVFRVVVDGHKLFDSGVMRATNAPRPVHVSLVGAQELRLEAGDAGDDITCDMANWAEARLTRAAGASARPVPTVDVAPFGRVVTWDAHRLEGARASRIEEFRAEDLFLETDVPREAKGGYRVPVSADGLGCIGLQWLNRRVLRKLALELAAEQQMPDANSVQVEGWFGESAWQGGWKPMSGKLTTAGKVLTFELSAKAGAAQTQKVRWLFPCSGRPVLHKLSAFTWSRWETAQLRVEVEPPANHGIGKLSIYNGELLQVSPGQGSAATETGWELMRPLSLDVRYARPSSFKSDSTVLQFSLPAGAVSVAVEDVLSNDCVYLPDYGLFVTREPAPVALTEYKRRIAGQKTILQQVREMPDQTLTQAMARTHHDAQREGPVMLSLACDNLKFVLERDGTLRFPGSTNSAGDFFARAGELRPQTGGGQLTRALERGWLPIPVITTIKDGLVWRERVFVAPADDAGKDPARLNRLSVCLAEFSVSNTQPAEAQAALGLTWLEQSRQQKPAALPGEAQAIFQLGSEGLHGMMVLSKSCPLQLRTTGAKADWLGTLPPGGTARLTVCLAEPRVDLAALRARLNQLRDETAAYWEAVLAPAMQVETPEPLLNDAIRSSEVRCLIAARNEADGARIAPWISAMSYGPLESEANSVIRGMAFMGHEEFARRGLDFFVHRYNASGFLTTGYTLYGTPWHLWTLAEYHQLYHNTEWLGQVAPEASRVGEWMIRQTQKTKHGGAPGSGLMPPGVLADWNAFACYYAMNGYTYAALRGLGEALADLPNGAVSNAAGSKAFNPRRESARFESAANELRANILHAYHWTQAQAPALRLRNGTWIPHYPSQVHSPGKLADFFPGQDGGRSWCYDVELGAHQLVPSGVLGPADRETTHILDHMEDVQFLSDGWFDYPASANEQDWFDLGGFSKVQPYYTRNCEIYALRDDVKPFIRSYFNTLAAMLNPEVMSLWEHFHHSGAWDKTHETGYFLQQTHMMLLAERGDSLWLAPMLTTNWLANGKRLVVNQAPTRFGPVSYRLESSLSKGFVRASIQAPVRQPPREIVLRLPHPQGIPVYSVLLNGKLISDVDKAEGIVRLKPTEPQLEVQVWYEPARKTRNPKSHN
jgi:hypothetical protein